MSDMLNKLQSRGFNPLSFNCQITGQVVRAHQFEAKPTQSYGSMVLTLRFIGDDGKSRYVEIKFVNEESICSLGTKKVDGKLKHKVVGTVVRVDRASYLGVGKPWKDNKGEWQSGKAQYSGECCVLNDEDLKQEAIARLSSI